ncbi:tetratricopeptide repeat protein [Corallococcus aberystwythensis]|uniref:tetratricopeptide repeat protein n=1 Tax=Corallococcus aberystwythensis TaxID=2316722 RepID=UPI0013156D34|nr:tetratricopeptide repeat protein [Corallococcus aberystwythensis]
MLDCDFSRGGVWAGVAELLGALLPRIRAVAPSLLVSHDTELVAILPQLRETIRPRHQSLVDLASDEERFQIHALERADRLLHGAIALLAGFHSADTARGPWLLVCEHFGRAGALSRRFFRELVRRQGTHLDLTLLVVVDPGEGDATCTELSRACRVSRARLRLAPEPQDPAPVAAEVQHAHAQAARELEHRVQGEPEAVEASLPRLIKLWEQSAEPENALRWRTEGLRLCVRQGYYEDALRYGEPLLHALDALSSGDPKARWDILGKLSACLAATGRAAQAARLLEEEVLAKSDAPALLARAYYTLAVYHARYLPTRDLRTAEQCVQKATEEVSRLEPATNEARTMTLLINNALALVRLQEGKPEEALRICQASLALLDAHYGPDERPLQRAALMLRLAELFLVMGAHDEALTHYSAAIAIDPSQADYYGMRGVAAFKAGRLLEAEADFQKALTLGPPSAAIWVNLGQCYRAMERAEDAIRAYSSALALESENVLTLVGRAQAHELLGRVEQALADYDAALQLTPDDAPVLASRAVLHYEAGRLQASLADLDRAVSLAPDTPEFHQNRSVVLSDLGRRAEAIADLSTYLRLQPDAEDRAEVEEKLSGLREALRTEQDS